MDALERLLARARGDVVGREEATTAPEPVMESVRKAATPADEARVQSLLARGWTKVYPLEHALGDVQLIGFTCDRISLEWVLLEDAIEMQAEWDAEKAAQEPWTA